MHPFIFDINILLFALYRLSVFYYLLGDFNLEQSMNKIFEEREMNKRFILVLCVLFVMMSSVILVNAASTRDSPPDTAPLQTCNTGVTKCLGVNNYECVAANQWLLREANSVSCGYSKPVVCTEAEKKCSGFTQYLCLNNQWVLNALNSESCGYICTSGASYCDGVDLQYCSGNAWSEIANSPSCGYIPPSTGVKEVLTNIQVEAYDEGSSISLNDERIDLGTPKTVTLYSGDVSGGLAFATGGVPGGAYVELCTETPDPSGNVCNDYKVPLPLNSEVTFVNIQYIRLHTVVIRPPSGGPFAYWVGSNVVYSAS